MKYKTRITLPDYMTQCPKYWENFIDSLGEGGWHSHNPSVKQINDALLTFNGRYIDSEISLLIFKNDEDHVAFILSHS